MTIVAIDVDAQRTFSPLCPTELPIAGGNEIVAELNAQAALAQLRVLTKDAHNPHAVWVVDSHQKMGTALDFPNADMTWVRHAEVGTEGFKALPGLPEPEQYDFLVYKGVENHMHPYGACYHDLQERISTGLLEWLTVKNATEIFVGGLATDYCVKNTVLQLCAYSNKWQVWVNLSACRGIGSPALIQAAVEQMQQAGANVVQCSKQLPQHAISI